MRRKIEAKNLRPKMLAFLPFFGKLLKSKVTHVEIHDSCISVRYTIIQDSFFKCQCFMNPSSVYEIYIKPKNDKSKKNSKKTS